jgi:hypothetical protein
MKSWKIVTYHSPGSHIARLDGIEIAKSETEIGLALKLKRKGYNLSKATYRTLASDNVALTLATEWEYTTPPKLPSIAELSALLVELKRTIHDDYRVEWQEDDTPTMQVTIGVDIETGDWNYQSGDNSFTGGAYGYHYWGVGYLTRRSNSRETAKAMLDDVANQLH